MIGGELTRRFQRATEEELIFGTETCRLMPSWSDADDDGV